MNKTKHKGMEPCSIHKITRNGNGYEAEYEPRPTQTQSSAWLLNETGAALGVNMFGWLIPLLHSSLGLLWFVTLMFLSNASAFLLKPNKK